jgi:phage tail protein X
MREERSIVVPDPATIYPAAISVATWRLLDELAAVAREGQALRRELELAWPDPASAPTLVPLDEVEIDVDLDLDLDPADRDTWPA